MVIAIAAIVAAAQANVDQQEILKIHEALDKAFISKDIAYFENVLAADYVYSDPQGKSLSRAENLAQFKKEFADTSMKLISSSTENPKVKVSGNMALVTADWNFTGARTTPFETEPHTDRGRYTGVYEKSNGKWMLVAEHFSEAPHDRKLMEQEVIKASEAYTEALRKRDKAGFERLLADDYMFTSEDGKTRNRSEDIAHMTAGDTTFESVGTADRKVRVIGNSAAVETGIWKAKGTNKGKAFDETGRYTTTWAWRSGRWQIVSDHTSLITQ
ncbi:MAG: nuclear transport factor 2 family protein [Pyrinomonadaceae bacterium]